MAVEDSVGELQVGVFDGAVFSLVSDDGAGNLDDCFVAVLATLFNGGFCAVEFGLLAVNEDNGLRLALDSILSSLGFFLLGFVLVFRLLYDVAGLVHKNGLCSLPLAINVLGGRHGCVGACCGFEFGAGGDDGTTAELDVLDKVGEGDVVLGFVLGHGCLLMCWVHVCFDALDVHIYLYSFKLHRFFEWCACFRHAANRYAIPFSPVLSRPVFWVVTARGMKGKHMATQAVRIPADWETPPYCRYTD